VAAVTSALVQIFKAYYGVNPNGQFGKQDGYREFAVDFQIR
jgi:hypothetical protein